MSLDIAIREALIEALRSPEGQAAIRAAVAEAVPAPAAVLPFAPGQRVKTTRAAQLADRHPDTVRRAIKRGDLKATKPKGSREYLIEQLELRRWMDNLRRTDRKALDLGTEVDKAVRHLRG